MTRLNLRVKKLENFNNLKNRDPGNAGIDLYAAHDGEIKPGESKMIKTGISTSFDENYYLRVAPRSGLALKSKIDVMAGVVDSSYRGEICVILINLNKPLSLLEKIKNVFLIEKYDRTFYFKAGDRIAQAIPEMISVDDFEFETELEETSRGEGGFGSTGK